MKTGKIDFIRAQYKRTSANADETKTDFNLIGFDDNTAEPLTEIARLEKDNGFHNRSLEFDYWLYLKPDLWKNSIKTGLAFTGIDNVLFGDIPRELHLKAKNDKGKNFENPQHFIVVHSLNLKQGFTIDVFKNLSFRKKKLRDLFIREHFIEHIYKKRTVKTVL
jgi:hypothetical protein